MIAWPEPIEGAEEVESYMIFYCPSSLKQNSSSWKSVKTTTKSTFYRIVDLEPCTSYTVYVRAKSKQYHEYGPESNASTAIRTKPLPPGPPRLVSRTQDSVTVQWTAPAKKVAKLVDFYLIKYICTDDRKSSTFNHDLLKEKYHQEEFPPNKLQAHIDGLQSGIEYQFKVQAVYFKITMIHQKANLVNV